MRPFTLLLGIGIVLAFLFAGHSVFAISYADTPVAETATPVTATAEAPTTTPEPVTATTEPATATSEPATVVPPTATISVPAATAPPTAIVVVPSATTEVVPTIAAAPTAAPALPTVLTANAGPPIDRRLPLPDQPVAEAPLSLAQRISTNTAYIGADVQYSIQISGSRPGMPVEVRNLLPSELDILSIVASAGTCSTGNQPICQLTLGQESVTIIIYTRVSSRATAGSNLIAQAAAQDNANFTAASDPISLTILSAPIAAVSGEATGAPVADPPSAGSPAANPGVPSSPTNQLGQLGQTGQPVGIPAIPGGDARQDSAILPVLDADVRTVGAAGEPAIVPVITSDSSNTNPVSGAVIAEAALEMNTIVLSLPEPAAGPQYAASKLPNTAATTTITGWVIGLLGFATIAYGLRRIRRAALLLDDQRSTQLKPLLEAMRRVMRG